ncbi:MAG: aminoacyl-tRNA hydrolase, partial [Acidobacteria bacterium]|nr:aminoacyl-tRNA hydrolase [Acidobacteriota bacterium]
MNRLILGLGNPGEQYRSTRHNVGFRVVEELARRFWARLDRLECNALTARAEVMAAALADGAAGSPDGPLAVLLAQPQTYMNRSGFAARCLFELHGLAPPAVLVVYDEVNLPFGRLRLRRSGSPAGHRGIESILENLRTDEVPRLRIGIGAPGALG